MDVAPSKQKGYGISEGAAKAMGFVPSIGSVLNVGAMDGRAFVTVKPISPALAAISG